MKIVKPSVVVEDFNSQEMLKKIEAAGRTCYKSESKRTNKSANVFIKKIIKNGHESVLEHEKISVRVICDRGVTHEIVRHRIASYSQESTRYVNYNKKGMEFIHPCFFDEKTKKNNATYIIWVNTMRNCEDVYNKMLEQGMTPQEARSVLPNSLKTEIVMTLNLRSWRNFFKLRCAKDSHPQMREVAWLILEEFNKSLPEVFGDIYSGTRN